MMNFFRYDNPVFNVLTRICDIFVLNILWLICSIPIITMGAATSALYYSMLKINRETDSSIVGMFFHSFRQNLKQGCGLTILFILSGLFLYIDFQVYKTIEGTISSVALVTLIVLIILWGMTFSYAFPVLAQFENTMIGTLKNAFLMSVLNLGKTIIILFLSALPFILLIGLPNVFVACFPIMLIFGIGAIAFINAKFFVHIFDKYI